MELAPIVVFSYNRPNHLQRTLEALAKNDLAQDSVLYIYCDGAKSNAIEEQRQRIAENRRVAHAIKGFREVHVVERECNVGLMENIVNGVTDIVNVYGKVIVFEDDMLTSPGTLRYFNDALEVYKEEEKVMHVVSYVFPHKYPLPETFFYQVPYPGGGWATWQRAWKYYPREIEGLYDYWKKDWRKFNYWNHDGSDLVDQLVNNYNGTLRTWFIRWYAEMFRRGGLALYPGRSLVTNIGFDGTGDNCHKLERNPYWVEHLAKNVRVKRIKKLKVNKWAAREIYAFHSGYWYNRRRRRKLLNKIKMMFVRKA